MKRRVFFFTALAACGGTAVIDPPSGEGGHGGSSSSTSVTSSTASSTAVTTSTSTGPSSDCEAACMALYQCGLAPGDMGQLCPGFSGDPDQQVEFLFGDGSSGCVASCEELPAVIGLIDPADCPQTIADLEAVSPDFANLCQDGF